MEQGDSEQEQREDQNPRRKTPEEYAAQIRGEHPRQEHHLPQRVNAPILGARLGRINWRMRGHTETERRSTLISHVKRKHTRQPTQASPTSVQGIGQVPGPGTSSAVPISAKGKSIPHRFRCQREDASPTDSPLYKRHKIHTDEPSTSKLAIEHSSSSDSSSSPEEQKAPSPQPGTSREAQFDEEMEEITERSEKLSTKQQLFDTLRIQPVLLTQEASSSGSSRQTSSTSYPGRSSVPETLPCRLPISKKTRAALTLCILGRQNVKEDEGPSDTLEPQMSDSPTVEAPKYHQIVQSSALFDIAAQKGTKELLDSRLMPPPKMRIESLTHPKKIRKATPKKKKKEPKPWWCIGSVTFYPPSQLHQRFPSLDLRKWNITSYPKYIPCDEPGSLQFPSGSYRLCAEPPGVEPAEEDEELVGRPSIHGTPKRILGLVPNIGNITLTSILWAEPSPNEVFCRRIKRCETCGMPQGLFTRLPITVELLWFDSLDETQPPFPEIVECAFPVDIWGTAAFLKKQDKDVGWILDSKVLDVDLMLVKYAPVPDYRVVTFGSKSSEGRSFKRKTSESDSESSESDSS